MNVINQFLAVIFTVILGFSFILDANAKRLGGGQSFGKQSSAVQRQAAPTQASPNSATAPPSATKPSPMASPAQPKKFGLGGMVGGIAAGLGIGMLLSHFGLGDAAAAFFTGMLMLLAVAMIGMWLLKRFAGGNNQASAFQLNPANGSPSFLEPRTTPYAEKTGSPVSSSSTAVAPSEQWVDQESFLNNAKKMFVQLQEASDKQDLDTLRQFTTPEMFALIRADFLNRREAFSSTQVLTLNADLFHVEKEGDTAVASIRFSGLIREETNNPSTAFEEVWNWTKPVNGQTGWVLAGIQQIS